ncbi:MAG TPA: DUF5916 domain-containing protein [Thermoanaerobaculia bacterium]|nr:DUF5916 domain-containing protein [Thermoanaerobaculia bacterium]
MRKLVMVAALAASLPTFRLNAEVKPPVPQFRINRATGPITIDGDLSEEAWQNATKVEQWYETNPGDNTPPKVRNIGYLTYDDRYFYAGFHFYDPNPSQIRAPFTDRDFVSSDTDYGGVILDTRNDRRTGILMLANPRGIQYDSVSDDTTGNEDSSPDFYWDSAAKITNDGWTLEIRIPFSSLRYEQKDPQEWGIMLYRNYPRDRRYQMFSNRIPRGSNCFICTEGTLVGLENLPKGGHLIVAPYVTAKADGAPRGDLGSPLVTRPVRGDGGIDAKWTPNAAMALDATINPDFSQVESDIAAISANQRFAIFYPEKRPFFLEGNELFSTPIQAVYTRTITSPRFGIRATGKFNHNGYTILVTQDRGGGSVIIPGPTESNLANQDFSSTDVIGRIRHDFGRSYASFLLTDREFSGGYNRVLGPDFQWRINPLDTLTGQVLVSQSRTPNVPDQNAEWDGRKLSSWAGDLWWSHSGPKWDLFTEAKSIGDEFRADAGFLPQVGFHSNYGEIGYTTHPAGFFSRVRYYVFSEYDSKQDGALLGRLFSAGFGGDGKYSSFTRIRYQLDEVRTTSDQTFTRHQLVYQVNFTPNRRFAYVQIDGWVGQQVDFANDRLGEGANVNLSGIVRPTDHLELRFNNSLSWLKVRPFPGATRRHLFTAQAERVKATYTFNSRMFFRGIAQYQRTNSRPSLYLNAVDHYSGSLATQLLFAYKLNWQTLLYLGAGDLREATADQGNMEKSARQYFMKLSYAFQR